MTKQYTLVLFLITFFTFNSFAQVNISGTTIKAFDDMAGLTASIIISGDVNLTTTSANKNYSISGIPVGSNIEVKAESSNTTANPAIGCSTLDLVYIRNHILGTKKFKTPYHKLAADVNQDKNITTADLILLKNIILHKVTSFPFGNQWRFVAATEVVPNDPSQDIVLNSVKFNNIQKDEVVNFKGYKLGDVSGDAAVGSQHEVRANNIYSLKSVNQSFKKGDKVDMLINASDINEIQGLQFTMNFDKHVLSFSGVKGEQEFINEDNFSISDRCEGLISASILTEPNYSSDKLFNLSFRAREDGELKHNVYMCSSFTTSEAYNNDLETLPLNLVFEEPAPIVISELPVLFQNEPNPFFTNTSIGFEMPQSQDASFSIFNSDGKLIKEYNEVYTKGINKINLVLEDFPATGIYFYQLKTKDFVGTKKMMVIK